MIRHLVLMRFPEGSPDGAVGEVVDALRALPAQIPEIRTYHVGPDLGLGPGTWDLAVVAEFDDVGSYRTYIDHPAHRRVVDELVDPMGVERARLQMEA